ncbi:MAG: pyridoxal phosphate-dependent aminotransferase [Methylacidiphilales bacterium]|nr:pyridoxal phosphate-dependent aminotransferase [Candidatus Methylacidiphilales bacterium]
MLSQRSTRIKPSPTLVISALAQTLKSQGKDIVSLSAGEPDFDTPKHIKDAAIKALHAGFTKYTAVDGIQQLKKAILNKCLHEYGQEYNLNNVIVSNGAKHSIYTLLEAIINPGDEVLIPIPYWVSYPDITQIMDGVPKFIMPSNLETLKISPQDLEKAITKKSKILIINSPNNPSGSNYTKNELRDIADVLLKYPKLMVLSDDIYEHIYWGKDAYVNLIMVEPKLKDRVFLINGVSKSYAMTGWRIGYCVGNSVVINAMSNLQSQSTSNPNSIAQYAAVEALEGSQSERILMNKEFQKRHDIIYSLLNQLPKVRVIKSDGAFYSFPDFSEVIKSKSIDNDITLASRLLSEAGVAIVPGSAFGMANHLRFSFATSEEVIIDAITRIKNFICN